MKEETKEIKVDKYKKQSNKNKNKENSSKNTKILSPRLFDFKNLTKRIEEQQDKNNEKNENKKIFRSHKLSSKIRRTATRTRRRR
ncbi:hypothetical protein E2C01_101661 [Portunus trituberculatus]|uniref:Uncharacterized protein n=1 Tax=Portunus trituberculatus TaxID=210409 RepID=A0A5B7KFG3_PORTR|nr:hypothetical protein [Portunus trituberculatus]